jgi:hypothetical protein
MIEDIQTERRWFETVDGLPALAIYLRGDNRGVVALHLDTRYIDLNYVQGTPGEPNV